MSSSSEADAAIKALNNFNFMGSCISVEVIFKMHYTKPNFGAF